MAKTVGTSGLLDAWADIGLRSAPDISKINQGWVQGDRPPAEQFNWLQGTFTEKLNHALSRGAADWDATTAYLAGAVAISGGQLWIAAADNAGSTPSDANANWGRIWSDADIGLVARRMQTIETADNRMGLTVTGTDITVDAGQTWLWRDLRRFSSSSFSAGERTFSTVTGGHYHLLWDAPGTGQATPISSYPNGRLHLLDITNEFSTAANLSTEFDGTHDRMLISGVSNDAGVISLFRKINRAGYHGTLLITRSGITATNGATQTGSVGGLALPKAPLVARGGIVNVGTGFSGLGSFAGGDVHDHDRTFSISNIYRGGFDWTFLRDYSTNFGVEVHLVVED